MGSTVFPKSGINGTVGNRSLFDNLQLGTNMSILQVGADPRSTSVDAIQGSLIRFGNQLFRKRDNGSSTNVDFLTNDYNVVSKSTTYTVTIQDDIILANTGTAWTATMPTEASATNKIFKFQKTTSDFNALTINDDAASLITTLNTQGETVTIVTDGTSWYVLDRYIPTLGVQYTPSITWSGTGLVSQGIWWRRKNRILVNIRVTGGTSISGGALIADLPSGLTFDTAATATGIMTAGDPFFSSHASLDIGTTYYPTGLVRYVDSNSVDIVLAFDQIASATNQLAGTQLTNTVPFTFDTSDWVDFWFEAPISGWKG